MFIAGFGSAARGRDDRRHVNSRGYCSSFNFKGADQQKNTPSPTPLGEPRRVEAATVSAAHPSRPSQGRRHLRMTASLLRGIAIILHLRQMAAQPGLSKNVPYIRC